MKNLLVLFVFWFGTYILSVAQYTQVYDIKTPNNSIVEDTYDFTGTDFSFTSAQIATLQTDLTNNYNGAILIDVPSRKYNCHAYAWHVYEGGSEVWIGYNTSTAENIYWTDGSYTEVPENLATKVSYHESGNHSAVRLSSTLYQSKWGNSVLVQHAPNNVPSGYNPSLVKKFYVRNPYSITGSTTICGSATYTVANLPDEATVTWSNSSNLAKTGTTGGSNVFTATGGGAAWIEATVTVNSVNYSLPRKIVNAYPALSGAYTQDDNTETLSSMNHVGYTGGAVTVTFSAISGVSYSWSGAITGTGNTKTYTIPSPQYFSITVTRTVPGCGTESATYTFNVTYDIGGCMAASYNPDTGTAEINFDTPAGLQELKRTYLVRLIDIYGRTVKESRSQGNTVEWNITSLQNNIYFIRIYDQNNHIVKTEKIIKRNQ